MQDRGFTCKEGMNGKYKRSKIQNRKEEINKSILNKQMQKQVKINIDGRDVAPECRRVIFDLCYFCPSTLPNGFIPF